MIRSRIAPTPSGFLHLGNAFSFVLTALLTKVKNGELSLRIDDLDAERSRPEFVEDIFEQLNWLGITWNHGPQDPLDFFSRFSQSQNSETFNSRLSKIATELYACSCTRSQILKINPSGLYPGTCRNRGLALNDPELQVRVKTSATPIVFGDKLKGPVQINLANQMGDFVVRRKGGLPSYQWVSACVDISQKTNLIVRGEDLIPSTAAQLWLSQLLGEPELAQAEYYHHPLLVGPAGEKLSKSKGADSLATMRAQGLQLREFYSWLAEGYGLPGAKPQTFNELLDVFSEKRLRLQPKPWAK